MKRITVVLAVVLLLLLCQASQAADLQAGWYADFFTVYVLVPGTIGSPDWGEPRLVGSAHFYDSPLGTYGPFEITDGPYHESTRRIVSVPVDAHNVGPDQSIALPIDLLLGQGDRIAYLSVTSQSDYNPSQMYMDLWQRRSDGTNVQVWSQMNGGLRAGTDHILYDTVVDGSYYFKVNVVPEPTSILPLLLGVVGLASLAKRRR